MSLFARLERFLDEYGSMLLSDDADAHLAVIKRLKFLLDMEESAAQAIVQESRLSNILCCECGSRVLNKPDYVRLKLCTMCMCSGLFATCDFCGENYPEHHPGGRGCDTWERREDDVPSQPKEQP